MKKFIVYSLWLIVFFLYTIFYLPQTIFAASGNFALSPSTGSFNKGCSFKVDVVVNTGGANSDGADAIIIYDPTRLTVSSVTTGKAYADYPTSSADPATGKITISGVAPPGQTFNGSAVFASLNMTVASTAPAGVTQMKFDFDPNDKSKTSDSNIGTIEGGTIIDTLTSVTDGSYTVGTGACGAASSSGTTGGSTSVGGPSISTPSAVTEVVYAPPKKLPAAGDNTMMILISAVGGVLTILGLVGLALL